MSQIFCQAVRNSLCTTFARLKHDAHLIISPQNPGYAAERPQRASMVLTERITKNCALHNVRYDNPLCALNVHTLTQNHRESDSSSRHHSPH